MLNWLRRVAARVSRLDRALVRRTAAIPPSPVDRGLKALTTAADHGVLWFVVAAVLTCPGGGTRRAAMRGVLALGGASLLANAVAKPMLPRRRPVFEEVPVTRRLRAAERPGSSSFPSGHAASAAAFTTAVTMESPAAGMVLLPLAVAVAGSRVHVGVHWPSDVAAGTLLGTGIALITLRWWPAHPWVPGPPSCGS